MPREQGEKTTAFPGKEERYLCWNSRDEFWKCIDSGGTAESCKELRKLYEEHCPSTWVKHFDRKHKYEKFKELMKEGYEPLNDKEKS
ncbi:cytochrome c oxidase assembly factor 6 homolog [Macrobrachium nipponense]|uniref:cytochrome c oxidase assembly factor 6 homolog n=1 Tax=Macrobrachium nipponense TaxID=159736 RepID=UPI0030C89067